MFTKVERLISIRNLKPKKKEGFLKVISIFSFLGIMLGVAILIIVMSVMNGFQTDLTNKILGLNPHIVIQSNEKKIEKSYKIKLQNKYKDFLFSESFKGEGVIFSNNKVKGILVKGLREENIINLFQKNILINNELKFFSQGSVLIGSELSFNLNIVTGDKINIMSSAFVSTPIGDVPKEETFKVAGIFNSGFYEFDQNLIFINLEDSLSIFDKDEKDINLEIHIKEPLKADFFKEEISLVDKDFFVYSWIDLNKSFFSALKVERNVMFLILTLIIIVAAFNIVSGLTILIKNKTKEIAILKTLGLSNSSIKKSFFLTGFTIGFSATITGIVLGTIFSIYIEEVRLFLSLIFNLNIFPSDVYFLDKMPSEINPVSIFLIFICSLIITSLASYFPARAISKMKTINALKYE